AVASGQGAQPLERERTVTVSGAVGQVVEIGMRDLLGETRALRAKGKLDSLRHTPRAAKEARDPGTEEGHGPGRVHTLTDEARQPDGELSTQPPARDPRFMEHAAPSEGRGLRPCPVRRTATKPVEGLVAKDSADEDRVFGFGADPRQECLRRSHDLMQEALVPPSLLQDRAQVDRVDDLEVELVLGVHLEERFEGRRFGARGPQGLRGPLGADRRLADFLGRGGKEGHEHRWWHERLLDQPVIYSAAPGSINPSLAIIARDRHLCQGPFRPENDHQKAMSDTPRQRGADHPAEERTAAPRIELRTSRILLAWSGRADVIVQSGCPIKADVTEATGTSVRT